MDEWNTSTPSYVALRSGEMVTIATQKGMFTSLKKMKNLN